MEQFDINKYIKLPLWVDEYNQFIFDSNNNMVLSACDYGPIPPRTVDIINGKYLAAGSEFEFEYSNDDQLITDYGEPYMYVRGWGRLKHLENAEYIQDQIGLTNIYDSIPEAGEVLDLVHPENIFDYLVCTYSPEYLQEVFDRNLKEAGEHNALGDKTIKDFDENWNKRHN